MIRLRPLVPVLVMAGLLSGCIQTMHQWGYSCVPTPAIAPCSDSTVLITNLTQPLTEQRVLLPNGQACQEISDAH